MAHGGHGHDDGERGVVELAHTEGLSTTEVERLRAEFGWNEIKDRSKKWPEILWNQIYGDHFYPNSIPAMMWIAIIVCLAIQDWADAGVIIFLHAFNSLLGFYETLKAGDAVAALRSALAPSCNCKRDGEWRRIMARELVPGDLVILKIGDVVPADGILQEGGTCDLDQSGLTGESLPVKKCPGDTVYSGTVVKRGEQDFVITHIGEATEMGKGVALIQSVDSKGQVEIIMNRITIFLLLWAIIMNILLIIVEVSDTSVLLLCSGPRVQGCYNSEANRVISNFIVLMVAAIPIATPVVMTATMAIGARKMAAADAVVTRLSAIEELAGMTVLCSDKTGTLTKNVLTLDTPHMLGNYDPNEMIFKAALAAKAVDPDAIDKCIREAVRNPQDLAKYTELEFIPFDPVIKRTESTVRGPDGRVFKVTKGAPQVVLKLAHNPDEIAEDVRKAVEDFAGKGLRPIAVAVQETPGRWDFLGLISMFDPPRDDSAQTIENAIKLGATVKMITGDHLLIAKETCRRLGMGDTIMGTETLKLPESRLLEIVEDVDGFAEVFPENKFEIVALFQKRGHITGMTGDGVNDAPALRKANVGFAVQGATPAAQGAAAVILLTPGLSVIITAMKRSRKIFQRLQNYLIYRVFMSIFLLLFFFIAIIWADFDFPPLLIIIMCLVLDLSTMSLAYDKVIPSSLPNKWNLSRIIAVASVMGVICAIGCIIFLSFLRNSKIGLGKLQRGYKVDCGFPVPNTPAYFCGQMDFTAQDEGVCVNQVFPLYSFSSAPLASTQGGICNNTANYLGSYFGVGANHVPETYDLLHNGAWGANHFPYSSAVQNTVMFLVLCLTSQLAVLGARVDGWFFTRRPGYVLLTIVGTQMIATTIVAGTIRAYPFWNPNQGEGMIRLTAIDGRYIGASWLFSIIVFLIMEVAKYSFYRVLYYQNYASIKTQQRTKLKEDLRRRMTATRATRSGTASGMHPQDLKPQPVSAARAASVARPRVATADKGLRQPLLTGTDYAA